MTGREHSIERRKQRKSRNEKIAVPNGNPDTAYGYVCRRRRVPRARRISAQGSITKDPSSKIKTNFDDDGDGDDNQGLEDQNGVNEHTAAVSSLRTKGLVAKLRRNEFLISRMQKKYARLQKRNRDVKEECRRSNALLEQQGDAYRRACSRYEELVELLREVEKTRVELLTRNQRLKAERIRWNQDATLLKAVVYRLNYELEKCQDRLREHEHEVKEQRRRSCNIGSDTAVGGESVEEEEIAVAWGRVDFHVLAPLLSAYETNLAEKKSLIARYEREMTRTGGECKKVIAENERMHVEVEELRSKCGRYAEETRALNESVLSLKKRNDSFAGEVEDHKRESREIYWSYERKVKSMVDENESLRRRCSANVADLDECRERCRVLSEEVERMKQTRERTIPMEAHSVAIDECKRLFEELKQRYEGEKSRLSARVEFVRKKQCEKDDRLTSVTAERNHFEALTRILRRNLKRSQRRVDYLGRIAYSGRVSRESMKNQLGKTIAYCRELFAEYERVVAEREGLVAMLRQTERENADFDRIGKSIARRVDDLKRDLTIVQCDAARQMTTIEKRMKTQECRLKRKYRGKVRRLRSLIKQKEDVIGSLRREKRVTRDNVGTAERPPDEDK